MLQLVRSVAWVCADPDSSSSDDSLHQYRVEELQSLRRALCHVWERVDHVVKGVNADNVTFLESNCDEAGYELSNVAIHLIGRQRLSSTGVNVDLTLR